jgi:hypothetical protein
MLQRVRAALDAVREQEAASEPPAPAPQAPEEERPTPLPEALEALEALNALNASAGFQPSARRLTASLLGTLSDPEEATQPIQVIAEPPSSDLVSPAACDASARPDAPAQSNGAMRLDAGAQFDHAAPPDAPAEPEHAARPDENRPAQTPSGQKPATASPAVDEPHDEKPASEPKPRPGRRRSPAVSKVAASIAIVVVVTAGMLAHALAKQSSGTAPGGYQAGAPGSEAATRRLAAAWVAGQVSRSAIVSCDPVMCQQLRADGMPAAGLLELTSDKSNPLRSALIVATAAVRNEFGTRLTSSYAPAVIASFGSGDLRIDIRTITPQGPAAYRVALNQDLQARLASGDQLLRSNRLLASAAASSQLLAGQVDSRLLITIASIAAMQPVYVVSFGDSGPGADAGTPFRTVELADFNGAPDMLSSVSLRSALAFLRSQRPPYRAAHAEMIRVGNDQTVLRIGFSAPSPLGLLSAAGS